MTAVGFALFDTAIGQCGIAWDADRLVGVQLPESTPARTMARLGRLFPDAVESPPPPHVRQAADRMAALLDGAADDLADIDLDLSGVPPFHRRVYELTRAIPPGSTLTYGEIATKLDGGPGAARAVGQALGANPFPIVVPCHRVLAAGGKTGGFSATGGASTKMRMLAIEGAPAAAQQSLFD